jgi:hypothetical protein
VKILDSEVHPLDSSSVPYNFSSASSPLLHNAARALNLPARSPHSYLTLFDQRSNASSRFVSSPSTSSDIDVPLLDEKYTGHILVSGYQVSFVLPSELPPLSKLGSRLDNGGDHTPLPTKLRGRRGSISEKNVLLFMAGISMMVPYLTRPQRAPWLVSFVRMFYHRHCVTFVRKALHTHTSLPVEHPQVAHISPRFVVRRLIPPVTVFG